MRPLIAATLLGLALAAHAQAGNDVSSKIQAAEAALEKQDYPTAVAKLKALAVESPKDARVQYDLGFAAERTGDETVAAQAYRDAIAADATVGEPRESLGLMDARAGRMDAAHTELLGAANLATVSPELRGRALRTLAAMDEREHPDDARDELLLAVKMTGETAQDTLMAADLASKAGDDADAETAYRRLLTAEPGNIDAEAGLAHSLLRQQKTTEAEAVLVEALKTHPDDPRLVSQLAAAYAGEDKAAEAIPLMEKLRASHPDLAQDESTTRLLAHLYEIDGQHAQAEALYRALVARDAPDASLLDDLGGVLVKELHYAEAEIVLKQAVANRSGFVSAEDWAAAAEHLAYAASKNGDPRSSLQALAARATVLPNSPASLFLEAIDHDALHESKEAAKTYRAFLAIAAGKFPDEEFEARHRLVALDHEK